MLFLTYIIEAKFYSKILEQLWQLEIKIMWYKLYTTAFQRVKINKTLRGS